MKNIAVAVVGLIRVAVVAGGGYAVGRSIGRSSQDDVISDCKDLVAALQLAFRAPDDGA